MTLTKRLSEELSIPLSQIEAAVKLIDEGNTIPFIARYRKEVTGGLDDTQLRDLNDRLSYLRNLEKRREEVRTLIEGLDSLTPEVTAALNAAVTLAEIEDIYRPFRPKRKTRASVAKEKGLAPLADFLLAQDPKGTAPLEAAASYVDAEKGVETAQDALNGAMDIVAETVSDDAVIRKELRDFLFKTAVMKTTGEKPDTVYTMYYDYSEPVLKIAPHRVLAINRGENDEVLKVSVTADDQYCVSRILGHLLKQESPCTPYLKLVAEDSYQRLIFPSLERELRNHLTDIACENAISVFSLNLRHLLMQPPVKGCVTLGLDPAYRTGCKIAVVDQHGKVCDTTVIYPTPPQSKVAEAKAKLKQLIAKYGVTVIAIGNGTASRESELFVAELLKELSTPVSYMVVSEAGASVYSASKLAAEEFPEYDVSLRSAVSIARRLQDPLAELVKIDPKAIGVGQYQHDMPKARMDETLSGVVESCVNAVGVDLNSASQPLLARVSGINGTVAKNIIAYREENGAFSTRTQLNKVPKLGKKAFEQCAGFLRIAESENVLDNTAVHPESYTAAKQLLTLCGYTLTDLKKGQLQELKSRVAQLGLASLAQRIGVGEPTLGDIIEELLRPGRDPRDELPKPLLRSDVMEMKDLKPEMMLTGTVRNVIDFGAFVDIGVHEDGLVHISQICDRFIKHPSAVLKVGDIVKVKVLEVDLKRKRIALTMKGLTND